MADDSSNIWNYREDLMHDREIVGFDVEAVDGHIGKIDAHSFEADDSHIVVDTGFWIFDKRRLIPAGAVTAVDHESRTGDDQPHEGPGQGRPRFRPGTLGRARRRRGSSAPDYNEYYRPHGW